MVCLTSCVFRSIRFSGFARPHVGVRREGELYTRLPGGRKRGEGAPRDAHKMGNNNRIGFFPGRGRARLPLGKPAPARWPRPLAAPARGPVTRVERTDQREPVPLLRYPRTVEPPTIPKTSTPADLAPAWSQARWDVGPYQLGRSQYFRLFCHLFAQIALGFTNP